MEEWKDIEGYEGMYQVSNQGRVKSLKFGKEKIRKCREMSNGYLVVGLCKEGKRTDKLVHRLVAEAFLPNPNNLPQVNHKDENPSNNNVENLEWCTPKYNCNYGTRNQRCSSPKRVDQIDKVSGEVIRQWESTAECSRNGYSSGAVSECARGVRKQYKGYVWKYLQA